MTTNAELVAEIIKRLRDVSIHDPHTEALVHIANLTLQALWRHALSSQQEKPA